MTDETNLTPETAENEIPPVIFEEALEAILFAAGHEITFATLARVFETTPSDIRKRVEAYASVYNNADFERGVILLTYPDACQLCTKENYLPAIREALGIRKSGTLSNSALEVLAIVAYNQPVTRFYVDTLRRVDSSYAMTNLLDRGLIECKGRLDAPGRPMLYGTTIGFLRCFGLSSLSDLPKTPEEMKAVFEKAQKDAAAEEGDPDQIGIFDGEGAEALPKTEESGQSEAERLAEEVADAVDEVRETAPGQTDESVESPDEPSAEDNVDL